LQENIRRPSSPLVILLAELAGLTALANTDKTITNFLLIITDTQNDLRGVNIFLKIIRGVEIIM
jgi:hypothetical protein